MWQLVGDHFDAGEEDTDVNCHACLVHPNHLSYIIAIKNQGSSGSAAKFK